MMTLSRLRNTAATLLCLSGITHIAGLWFQDINSHALVGALFGAVYLYIGVGLYGISRFALVTAILFPSIGAALALTNSPISSFSALQLTLLCANAAVIVLCSTVLFVVRKNPSI
ncbi:MAG: hypothetical protein ACI8QT_000957 [Halioglobus sp.]|jgi:hypothetical protein